MLILYFIFFLSLTFSLTTLYFLPSILSRYFRTPHFSLILFINLTTGFTLLGWLVALLLVFRPPALPSPLFPSPPPVPPRPRAERGRRPGRGVPIDKESTTLLDYAHDHAPTTAFPRFED